MAPSRRFPTARSGRGVSIDGLDVDRRAAVELALEIRKEVEARSEEADRLRCRAMERAQIEAELAQQPPPA